MGTRSFFRSRKISTQPREARLGPDGDIDLDATRLAFRRLLGEIAAATNETPRSILEDEFKCAPSDEFWRARIGPAR